MAETVEKKVVDKNMLRFGVDGELTSPEGMLWKPEGQDLVEINRAVWNGSVKFNRALYHLSVQDFWDIPASGMDLAQMVEVESFKTDCDGLRTEIGYSGLGVLPPNTTDKTVEGSYTVVQDVSGLKAVGYYTQDAKAFDGYSYVSHEVVDVEYNLIPAEGGEAYPDVLIKVYMKENYTDGSSKDVYKYASGSVGYARGKDDFGSGATIGRYTGIVSAASLEKEEKPESDVFKVSALSGDFYSEYTKGTYEWDWSGSVSVRQDANEKSVSYGAYALSVSAEPETLENAGGTSTISYEALRNVTYSWTSGVTPEDDLIPVDATLSTTLGSLEKTSVSGIGNTRLDVGENLSSKRTLTVTIKSGTASDYCTIAQEAVSYTFEEYFIPEAEAAGGTVVLSVISVRNGKALAIGMSDVSISGLTGAYVSGVSLNTGEQETGLYDISIYVPVNTSESGRSLTVKVTQPGSGESMTFTVEQAANWITEIRKSPYIDQDRDFVFMDVLADGTGTEIYIPVSVDVYSVSSVDGKETFLRTDVYEIPATGVYGTVQNSSGATFSGGKLSCSSLGKTETSERRKIYSITHVDFTFEGTKYTKVSTGKAVDVYQEINEKFTSYGTYVLSVSAEPTSVANAGGTSTITYRSLRNVTYSWTSGATPEKGTVPVSGTLSTTLGTIEKTSVSGSGTTSLAIDENLSAARSATITLKSGTESATCTVTQEAVKYTFEEYFIPEAEAAGGTVVLSVISVRNGKALAIGTSNVSVSGLTGAYVSGVSLNTGEQETGLYDISVYVPENSSESRRSLTVKVTQPGSGDVMTFTIEQAGKESGGGESTDIRITLEAIFLDSEYSEVDYTVDAAGTGTMEDCYVKLQKAVGPTSTVYDSHSKGDVSVPNMFTGVLNNTSGNPNVYVVLYYGGEIKASTVPIEPVAYKLKK